MPRCDGAPAHPASNAPPTAAMPPRNLRRSMLILSPFIFVLLKQRELRTTVALDDRRLEARRPRRAMPLACIEPVPPARDIKPFAQQFRQFAAAAHAAAEFRIVVAPAAHFMHAAHHVLCFQR